MKIEILKHLDSTLYHKEKKDIKINYKLNKKHVANKNKQKFTINLVRLCKF